MLKSFRNQITDTGLKEVTKFRQLTYLGLGFTQITDAGLKEVGPCKKLKVFRCEGTKVTEAGVAELQQAVPKCAVEH